MHRILRRAVLVLAAVAATSIPVAAQADEPALSARGWDHTSQVSASAQMNIHPTGAGWDHTGG